MPILIITRKNILKEAINIAFIIFPIENCNNFSVPRKYPKNNRFPAYEIV